MGTPYDDTGATDAGSVYVYDLSSSTPAVPGVTLNNPSPAQYDYFGVSVAVSGTRVIVGAMFDDADATDAGSVYVYDLSSEIPTTPVGTLNNPDPTSFDQFGAAVAISGTMAVVGAHGDDAGAPDTGSAYVYDLGSATPAVAVAVLNNPGPVQSDFFGYSVAIADTRVVVGAWADDTGAPNAGSAYVYHVSSGTATVLVATLRRR